MIRSLILTVTCVVGFLAQQDQGPADASPTTPLTQDSAKSSPAATTKDSPAVAARVQDIAGIREQLGGGLAKEFADFSLEMPGNKKAQPQDQPASPNFDQQFRAALANQIQSQEMEPDLELEPKSQLGPKSAFSAAAPQDKQGLLEPTERQQFIWRVARQLEEVAAQLEQVHEYDRADHLRQQASELWKSVRR